MAAGFSGRGPRALIAAWTLSAATAVHAQAAGGLADLSLEELANIEITSASLRPGRLGDAPASAYVITGDDIRRSGATSLPEALRLAPNLQVARVNAYDYAIGTRAFAITRANKLLVMIDGRTVYSPLFAGVFWDAQDLLLQDVERIEVISGPAGVTWGSNAVMGVINVITRSAAGTQGALASVGAGNREKAVEGRYGGAIGAGYYRLYAKGFERQGTTLSNGSPALDDWRKRQAGFRADWQDARDRISLQGDAYDGTLEQPTPGTRSISGANLLGQWSRRLDAGSDVSVRAYLDRTERDHPGIFGEVLDIFDVSLQHNFVPLRDHELAWGLSYRHANDKVRNTPLVVFTPEQKRMDWSSIFAEDQVALRPDLRFTLGARLERNPYTGTEPMGSARLAWKLDKTRLLWTSLSRVVRSPSRLDRDLSLNPPFVPVLVASSAFRSETSNVLELGYRAEPAPTLSYSVTTFHHQHRHLRSLEMRPDGTSVIANNLEGTTSGVETWGNTKLTDRWRLSAGLVLVRQRLHALSGSNSGVAAEGNDPSNRWMLRSAYDLSPALQFDLMLRRIGALPDPPVPSYTALDARLGWRLSRELDFSVAFQNLLDPRHGEFGAEPRSEFGRGVFARLTWRQ